MKKKDQVKTYNLSILANDKNSIRKKYLLL